jgi:hypothetical protein
MESKNKDIVADFFAVNKQEIADNGFTRKVMLQLPVARRNHIIIGIFFYVGCTLSLLFAMYSGFLKNLVTLLKDIPPFYYIGAITLIPFVYICGMLVYSRNTRFGLI